MNTDIFYMLQQLKSQLTQLEQHLGQMKKELDSMKERIARPASETVLTDQVLQQRLGVCKRTTATWRKSGMIRYSKVGALIYYRLDWVLDFIEQNKSS